VLIATGAEMAIITDARDPLTAEGVKTAWPQQPFMT
jgi:hypothetical protein